MSNMKEIIRQDMGWSINHDKVPDGLADNN